MKALRFLLVAVLLGMGLTATAQRYYYNVGNTNGKDRVKASKNLVVKDYRLGDFTGINIGVMGKVIYSQQSGPTVVKVNTSDNILPLLQVEVKNGTLNIRFKKGTRASYNRLDVVISSPKIEDINLGGSGDLLLKEGIKSDKLSISIAGSGDLQGSKLTCKSLSASIGGSGDMLLKGIDCKNLEASVAGSGDMSIQGVKAIRLEGNVAGSGDMALAGTTQEAGLSIAGSGDIYAGNLSAGSMSVRVAGSGDARVGSVRGAKAEAHVSGSGTIRFAGGEVEQAEFSTAGSGEIYASDVKATQVKASTSGSGDIRCYATKQLTTRTGGSATVYYKGNPTIRANRIKDLQQM